MPKLFIQYDFYVFAAFVMKRTFSPREIWREASLGVFSSKCPVASVFVDDEVT